MTITEFEQWYRNKQEWLKYKARYLLSTIGWNYNDIDELISLTVEEMLLNLENIKLETVDSWVFFTMKNNMYNKLTYHTRKFCCEGDFSEYNIKNEEYDEKYDESYEKMSKILENRVENEQDLIVLNCLKNGNKLNTLNIPARKISNIVKKLKGLEPLKRIYKSKAKGLPKGRPKLNKIKEKKMRIYKGVAKLNDKLEIIKVYPSANYVYIDGYSRESVSKCCNGKLKSHKGYIWKFIKDIDEEKETKKRKITQSS